jgi:polyvinyl alcohol dehydrogenase (cytochrome)
MFTRLASMNVLALVVTMAKVATALSSNGENPSTLAGKAIFTERCSGCHDQAGGRAPPSSYLATRMPSEILYTLTNGEMRRQAAGLTQSQLRELAIFLTGREIDLQPDPAANLCRGAGTVKTDNKQWASWGHDINNTRFESEPGFTPAQLPRLKVKWSFALPGLTGAPIVAGGHLFISSRLGKVFSISAETGCTFWSYEAGSPVRNAIAIGALPNGMHVAFFGDENAIVHALDAANGKELWNRKIDDYPGARIVGSITFYDGVVYAPVTSADEVDAGDPSYPCCTFRGSVVALSGATGNVIWKGYTIQEPAKAARVNDAGTQMFGPSGAGVWSAPTIDVKRGTVLVATGDSYTADENDASDALIAFDIKSGKRLWVSQVLAGDAWIYLCPRKPPDAETSGNCPKNMGPDFDFSSSPILQTLQNGKDIVVAGSKSGIVYGFDPDARGKVLWSVRVGQGGTGIQIWGPATDRRRAYVATPGAGLMPGTDGGMRGIDLASGKVDWRTESPTPPCGWGALGCRHTQPAAVTLIPGAVFSGSLDGHLRAYDTETGAIIWDFDSAATYDAVNGVKAFGGNLDGAPQTVAGGTLFVNSGNATLRSPRHGDAVLAITVDGK